MVKPARCVLFLSIALVACGFVAPANAQNGAFTDPSGRPIGGHEGYGDWVDPATATVVVTTATQLVNALGAATPGTVVYVHDAAVIDMTGIWFVPVGPGVTLASGRGHNGSLGALLFNTVVEPHPQFVVTGTDARITGLRLRGPDTEKEPVGDCGGHDSTGILVKVDPEASAAVWSVRVDNNELWGWPASGIEVFNVFGVQVQYNHIHHNRRKVARSGCRRYNLGYGVVVSFTGFALMEGNQFDHNCHDIASDGHPGTSYEARFNLTLDDTVGHRFDVHGGRDRGDGTDIAGNLFLVHHNTFLQDDDPAFKIRGYPLVSADVFANEFRHSSETEAAQQVIAFGNFHVSGNSVDVDYLPAWFVSFSGESFWRLRRLRSPALGSMLFGDFDADGCSDALSVIDNEIVISRGARSEWTSIGGLPVPPVPWNQVRVGDFDNDDRSDLFYTDRVNWYVALSDVPEGTPGEWVVWNQSTLPIKRLGFGDFDGDGRTDVFKGNGTDWHVSNAGQGPWTWINSSSLEASDLRFHDFTGDGRTDVFHANGSAWFVSVSGASPWQPWNTSDVALKDLAFGDFDGDHRTDVFRGNGTVWSMSSAGLGPWYTLSKNSFGAGRCVFADFNGDQRCDVLSRRDF